MKNKLNKGERFAMGRIVCTVTGVPNLFRGHLHYRFTWTDDQGYCHTGAMPVDFVDNFTGHLDRPCLWSFAFLPEGGNSVHATTLENAIKVARETYSELASRIDPKSFRAHRTPEEVRAYHESI